MSHIIPPINAEAIQRKQSRFGISDDMLVDSSVPELPPAFWAAATAYPPGAKVSTGEPGKDIDVWASLQANNTGHAPAESPDWWQRLGSTVVPWTAKVWPTGSRVLRIETHSIYERLATEGDANGTPEATPLLWARVSPTHRWAMFDMLTATKTDVVSPLVIKLKPGRINALALLTMSLANVRVVLETAEELLYDVEDTLDRTVIRDWRDYFHADFESASNWVRLDVPEASDAVLTITVSSGFGTVSIGKCVVGRARYIGDTQFGPRVKTRSFNDIQRDKYGEIKDIQIIKSIPSVSQSLFVKKQEVLRAQRAIDMACTVPCVFAGLEDSKDEYAELLCLLGLCTDSEIVPGNAVESEIRMDAEGV